MEDKVILSVVLLLILTNYSSGLSSPTSEDQAEDVRIKKNPPKSCPHFRVAKVRERYQGNMEDIWVVSHITPRGRSQYVDGSSACGLFNFVPGECKCLRYSLSVDSERNSSLTRKTIGLEIKSQNFRYIESRLVFIENSHDVFQAQFLAAAQISFDGSKSTLTASPFDEEIYSEWPHAWIAFSNTAFAMGNLENTLQKIENILLRNGIDYKRMVIVDQDQCKPQA